MVTCHDPLVVEQAVAKALTDGGLSPSDCKALSPDNAIEVGRRLIEIARDMRERTGGSR